MAHLRTWKLESILKLFLWLFLCLGMGGSVLALLDPGKGKETTSGLKFVMFLVGNLAFQGAALLLIHRFLKEHELSWREAVGWWDHGRFGALGMAVVTVIVALPLAMLLGNLSAECMEWFSMHPEPQPAVKTLQSTSSWAQRLYFAAVAIGIAPVVEEFLFRGVLFPSIRQLGYPRVAFWGTSLLFGAFHGSLVTFVPLSFFAILLTGLYERTGVLLAPMLTHSLFNAANFVWLLVMDS